MISPSFYLHVLDRQREQREHLARVRHELSALRSHLTNLCTGALHAAALLSARGGCLSERRAAAPAAPGSVHDYTGGLVFCVRLPRTANPKSLLTLQARTCEPPLGVQQYLATLAAGEGAAPLTRASSEEPASGAVGAPPERPHAAKFVEVKEVSAQLLGELVPLPSLGGTGGGTSGSGSSSSSTSSNSDTCFDLALSCLSGTKRCALALFAGDLILEVEGVRLTGVEDARTRLYSGLLDDGQVVVVYRPASDVLLSLLAQQLPSAATTAAAAVPTAPQQPRHALSALLAAGGWGALSGEASRMMKNLPLTLTVYEKRVREELKISEGFALLAALLKPLVPPGRFIAGAPTTGSTASHISSSSSFAPSAGKDPEPSFSVGPSHIHQHSASLVDPWGRVASALTTSGQAQQQQQQKQLPLLLGPAPQASPPLSLKVESWGRLSSLLSKNAHRVNNLLAALHGTVETAALAVEGCFCASGSADSEAAPLPSATQVVEERKEHKEQDQEEEEDVVVPTSGPKGRTGPATSSIGNPASAAPSSSSSPSPLQIAKLKFRELLEHSPSSTALSSSTGGHLLLPLACPPPLLPGYTAVCPTAPSATGPHTPPAVSIMDFLRRRECVGPLSTRSTPLPTLSGMCLATTATTAPASSSAAPPPPLPALTISPSPRTLASRVEAGASGPCAEAGTSSTPTSSPAAHRAALLSEARLPHATLHTRIKSLSALSACIGWGGVGGLHATLLLGPLLHSACKDASTLLRGVASWAEFQQAGGAGKSGTWFSPPTFLPLAEAAAASPQQRPSTRLDALGCSLLGLPALPAVQEAGNQAAFPSPQAATGTTATATSSSSSAAAALQKAGAAAAVQRKGGSKRLAALATLGPPKPPSPAYLRLASVLSLVGPTGHMQLPQTLAAMVGGEGGVVDGQCFRGPGAVASRPSHALRARVWQQAFSSSSSSSSSGSGGGTLAECSLPPLWVYGTMQRLSVVSGHRGEGVYCLGVDSRRGRAVVSGGDDGCLKVWNAKAGSLQLTLRGFSGPISDVCVSPDGECVAAFSEEFLGGGGGCRCCCPSTPTCRWCCWRRCRRRSWGWRSSCCCGCCCCGCCPPCAPPSTGDNKLDSRVVPFHWDTPCCAEGAHCRPHWAGVGCCAPWRASQRE